jgi:3-hydroxyacyl-CoA dehydrogenase
VTAVGTVRYGRVAIVAIDHPPFNALSSVSVIATVRGAVEAALGDRSVDAIVVRGAGGCFSASNCSAEFCSTSHDIAAAQARLLDTIDRSGKPVVMALHGQASGLGFELALAGHYRVAAAGTKLEPSMPDGESLPAQSIHRLTHVVGAEKAIDLLISRRMVDAEEACAIGLVDRIVDNAYEALLAAEALVESQLVRFSDRSADLAALARWRGQLAGPSSFDDASRHVFETVEAAIFGASSGA